MADFAVWITAAENVLGWDSGSFLTAYRANRAAGNKLALESSALVSPLLDLLCKATVDRPWKGTATQLLTLLNNEIDEQTKRQKGWPKAANALTNKLRRIAPNLRTMGLNVAFNKSGDRLITLEFSPKSSSGSSDVDPQEKSTGFISPQDDANGKGDDAIFKDRPTAASQQIGFPDNSHDQDDETHTNSGDLELNDED